MGEKRSSEHWSVRRYGQADMDRTSSEHDVPELGATAVTTTANGTGTGGDASAARTSWNAGAWTTYTARDWRKWSYAFSRNERWCYDASWTGQTDTRYAAANGWNDAGSRTGRDAAGRDDVNA